MTNGCDVSVQQDDTSYHVVAGRFRLSFNWRGERWSHQLLLGGQPVASSFEWGETAADATRIVSPAYQQLHVHEEPDGPKILTVGQWGRHHFSGVFAVSTDSPSGGTLDIDVALRTRSEVQVLASTYVVHRSSSELEAADADRVVWSVADAGLQRVTLEPVATPFGPGSITLGEAGRREARVQALAALDPRSANHRLTYRWTWL